MGLQAVAVVGGVASRGTAEEGRITVELFLLTTLQLLLTTRPPIQDCESLL